MRRAESAGVSRQFASGDGPGALEVLEDARSRWVQYGTGTIQSLMDRAEPARLVLPYTRAMMASLVFIGRPRDALMLGLGGGSFVRFLQQHWPGLRIDVVEHDSLIVDIASAHFDITRRRPGLSIQVADARVALAQMTASRQLVLADLFSPDGLPRWMRERATYDLMRRVLPPDGVVAANLWTEPGGDVEPVIGGISAAFGSQVLLVPVTRYENIIALAFKRIPDVLDLPTLYARGRALRERTGIDFPALLDAMRDINPVCQEAFTLPGSQLLD